MNPTDQELISNYKASNPSAITPSPIGGGTNWYDGVKAGAYRPVGTSTTSSTLEKPTAVQGIKNTVSDAVSGFSNDFKNRQGQMSSVISEGNAPIGNRVINALGVGAGVVQDALTEGIKSLWNHAVTPQAKQNISDTVSKVLSTPAGQAGIQAAQAGMDKYNQWKQEDPESAKTLESVVNIASLVPVAEGVSAVGKAGVDAASSAISSAKETFPGLAQGASDVASNAASTAKNATVGAKNFVFGSDSTVPEVVGKITQATPEELPAATRALKSVNLTGSKTFSDISSKLDEAIKANTTEVDSRLGASEDLLKPSDVEKTIPVKGGTPITTNPVNDALKQLSDFYTKTNDPEKLAGIQELQARFESDGLTPKEINDLARTHGQVLNAYNANGELASGLSRQAAENTRTALKGVARDAMPDSATQAIDKNTSDLIKTKGMVDDMATKVQALENKLKVFNPLQRVGQFAGKAVNMATGGALKTFIKGLTGFGVDEGTTLNALQLQDSLIKNLKLLDKLNSMSPESAVSKIKSIVSLK